jgi:salicylate hydroxylase
MNEPILIVGGGLGGLTTALALAQRGWPVRVLEGAPEFGAIGYGIQFGPNVFHVLDKVGVSAAVLEKADSPPAVLMVDALTGEEITRVPTGPSFRARFKYPYIIIHRIDLHLALLEACRRSEGIELVSEAMVTGFADDGEQVAVTTRRLHVLGSGAGRRGWHPLAHPQPDAADGDPLPNGIWPSHHRADGRGHCRGQRDVVALWAARLPHRALSAAPRTLFSIVAVFADRPFGAGRRRGLPRRLEHAYRDAHPTMKALLAMLDVSRRQAVGDRDPIRHWHKGRVVLLGDAPSHLAVAGAGRLHGDRGWALPRRAGRCDAGRFRPCIPAICRRAPPADSARDAGIPIHLGRLPRGRYCPRRLPPDAGRTFGGRHIPVPRLAL